jgi:hypothetical protein
MNNEARSEPDLDKLEEQVRRVRAKSPELKSTGVILYMLAEVRRLRALRCDCDETAGHSPVCVINLPGLVDELLTENERLRARVTNMTGILEEMLKSAKELDDDLSGRWIESRCLAALAVEK